MMMLEALEKLLEGNVVLGKKLELSSGLYIVPVYKIKLFSFNLKDIEGIDDAKNGCVTVTPVILIKVHDKNIEPIYLENHESKVDVIPEILNSLDVSSILGLLKK